MSRLWKTDWRVIFAGTIGVLIGLTLLNLLFGKDGISLQEWISNIGSALCICRWRPQHAASVFFTIAAGRQYEVWHRTVPPPFVAGPSRRLDAQTAGLSFGVIAIAYLLLLDLAAVVFLVFGLVFSSIAVKRARLHGTSIALGVVGLILNLIILPPTVMMILFHWLSSSVSVSVHGP